MRMPARQDYRKHFIANILRARRRLVFTKAGHADRQEAGQSDAFPGIRTAGREFFARFLKFRCRELRGRADNDKVPCDTTRIVPRRRLATCGRLATCALAAADRQSDGLT